MRWKAQRFYEDADFTTQRNNKNGSMSPFGQNTAFGVREFKSLGEVRNIRRYQNWNTIT